MSPTHIDASNFSQDIVEFLESLHKYQETVELRAPEKYFDIHYIGIDALIKNKQSVGRPRDLEDLKFLQTIQGPIHNPKSP